MSQYENPRENEENAHQDTGVHGEYVRGERIVLSDRGADVSIEAVTNLKEPGEGLKSLKPKAHRIPGGV